MYSSETELLDETNFRKRRDITVDYILKTIPANGRVLDVGCGAAPVLSQLRKKGISCVGVEYSDDMIHHARVRLRSMGLDESDLYQGDCRSTPFEDESFDIVVCLGVISYVENFDEVLAEIRRLLKPGGVAFVSFRNKYNLLFFDPIRLVKTAIKILLRLTRQEPSGIGRFMDHREVQKKMTELDFIYRDHFGIGFGPIRINGHRPLSDRASIRISGALTVLFDKIGFQMPFRWLADVSLWVYTVKTTNV